RSRRTPGSRTTKQLQRRRRRGSTYPDGTLLFDEEAVEEMLTNFPTHDIDDIATKDFVRAEIAGVRTEVAGVRTEMASMKAEIIRWNIATMLVFAGLVIAAIRV
ncbi:MAG TPA: hypothetical protein PKE05_07735, partial [Microthrixaceae bacterium]|nr:hypothetical protein [Microthrixaceae bacterium]